jgi:hypothetical protein
MRRGEAVCRIVYVTGPKVFKMRLKEVKPPPRDFDYVKCVPIRDNHLKPLESNKVVIVNSIKESKPKPTPKPTPKPEKPMPTEGTKGSFSSHKDHFKEKGPAAPPKVEDEKTDKKGEEETPK